MSDGLPGQESTVRRDRTETLYEVSEIAVIRDQARGVLLLHSTERNWHFPLSTVRVDEQWDDSLRRGVAETTGIRDLSIGFVMMIRNYGPGEVDELPQYGVFFYCESPSATVSTDIRHLWIREASQLADLELFHPLIVDVIEQALAHESLDSS
jgi:hypothetical protein